MLHLIRSSIRCFVTQREHDILTNHLPCLLPNVSDNLPFSLLSPGIIMHDHTTCPSSGSRSGRSVKQCCAFFSFKIWACPALPTSLRTVYSESCLSVFHRLFSYHLLFKYQQPLNSEPDLVIANESLMPTANGSLVPTRMSHSAGYYYDSMGSHGLISAPYNNSWLRLVRGKILPQKLNASCGNRRACLLVSIMGSRKW